MVLQPETMIQGETPFCHLAIPMIIIPAALGETPSPGGAGGVLSGRPSGRAGGR